MDLPFSDAYALSLNESWHLLQLYILACFWEVGSKQPAMELQATLVVFLMMVLVKSSFMVASVDGFSSGSEESDHGWTYQTLSPAAIQFFKPGLQPAASPSEESQHLPMKFFQGSEEERSRQMSGRGFKPGVNSGVVVGIVLGAFVVGAGSAYVYFKRRANINKANSVLPAV